MPSNSRMVLNVFLPLMCESSSVTMMFFDSSSMVTAFVRHSALYCSNSCVFMGEIYKMIK